MPEATLRDEGQVAIMHTLTTTETIDLNGSVQRLGNGSAPAMLL